MTDLRTYGSCTLDQDGCTTCGDTAIPVRLVRFVGEHVALCEDQAGARAEIATAFTPQAAPGAVLLVHLGVAIAQIQQETP